MATVVLSYAGAALGTALGGPIGGIIGRAIGGLAGNYLDQQIFGSTKRIEGPRLQDLRVLASEEGAAIPALWGRMRISGQMIWATNIDEVIDTNSKKAGGKGGPKVKTTEYTYFANFAVGLCEGEIDSIGRVWADGKLLDISGYTTRLYRGTETQAPDSLIETIEGAGAAPAYRGLAYIVFERLPLERFGNRIPQLSFEVIKGGNDAASELRAVNIIPGSTEFGYDTTIITRSVSAGKTESENAHLSSERTDFTLSLDQLQATCSNVEAASLVVAWFGDDLRCGSCTVRPKVDNPLKVTTGDTWSVTGLQRASAHVVSSYNGSVAFGGTPSDQSVVRSIQDLRTRGLEVMFYPFILMDIAQGNTKPDPYGGAAQAAYPWRGRITSSIAPGRAGTQDKTAAAATELAQFMGTALPSHFSASGTTVTYSGPAEWSYRRMILHYAKLCAAAGGVDAFLIGSELRGLTTLRSSASAYPFVVALQTLAAEVKAILPAAKVSYAADWTEWFGHHPQDGSNDLHFHLDPLWASSAIDFIGIDNYMPLSDWRDGDTHLDRVAGTRSIYDLNYLQANISGGEGFDWFYASPAARNAQTRTPITDGAYGKPWVFRYKDLKSWWQNAHRNRPGGVESATTTAWVPQSKPFWFTEAGCPAIDKGTNQPNVFVDVKSSENAVPFFSGGQQDDLLQNRYVRALQDYWTQAGAHNPVSSVYGQSMLRPQRIFYWAWDARPFPAFPVRTDIWSDGANVPRGHWLNGRLGATDIGYLVKEMASRFGFQDVEVSRAAGLIDGFVLERPMSGREALESLLAAFAIDAIESDGVLKFVPRQSDSVLMLTKLDVAELSAEAPLVSETRLQETDLPRAIRMTYVESGLDYRSAAVTQVQSGTASAREMFLSLPAAVPQSLAQTRVDVALAEAWAQQSRAQFAVPPSLISLEPGDVVTFEGRRFRITDIADGVQRKIEAVQFEPTVYDPPPSPTRAERVDTILPAGAPQVIMMDLATGTPAPRIAAQATPWPGTLAVLRSTGTQSFALNTVVTAQATVGETLTPFAQGRLWRLDQGTVLDVRLSHGALSSASEVEVLNGANIAAIGTSSTGYEIVQFTSAQLIAADTYRLSGFLRAQAGSAAEMLASRSAGQDFVLLNEAVIAASVSLDEATRPSLWRLGPAALDQGHPSYVELTLSPTLKALRPLSPVRLKARREGAGVAINWIRQTRASGDSWDVAEVPLGEDAEAYQLDVLNGPSVVRSFTGNASQAFYSDAEMTADFGAPQSTLTLRVAQLSAVTGAGTSLERTLNV
jgi:hypothetical protein